MNILQKYSKIKILRSTYLIDRNKFKSELGKQLYDKLKPLAPNEDWLELMIWLSRGDDRRKIVLDFLKNEKDWGKVTEFILEQWG